MGEEVATRSIALIESKRNMLSAILNASESANAKEGNYVVNGETIDISRN